MWRAQIIKSSFIRCATSQQLSLTVPLPSRAYGIIKLSSKVTTSATQPITGRRDFTKAIKNNAAYKERSHNTHYKIHVPEIQSRLPASRRTTGNKTPPRVALPSGSSVKRFEPKGESVRTILLGDSMFERFKTKCELHHTSDPG